MFKYRQGQEIHIHLDNVPQGCFTTYCETEKAIEDDYDIIHTTQTHFCSWKYHRKVFVHVNGEAHEITMGDCKGITKYLREGHNLEKLLIAGAFDWF